MDRFKKVLPVPLSTLKGVSGLNGVDGKNGVDGRDGINGLDGKDGIDGVDGTNGQNGETPEHEWRGERLRFKNPDGTWGKWVDLRGPQGQSSNSGGGSEDIVGKQKARLDGFYAEQDDYYTEVISEDANGNPLVVSIFDNPSKTKTYMTKTITYLNGDPISILIKDELTRATMTKTITYLGNYPETTVKFNLRGI